MTPSPELSAETRLAMAELRCEFAKFRLEMRYQFYILMILLSFSILIPIFRDIP